MFNEYLGIPFEEKGRTREGLDCWGLVILMYAERLGISLPDLSTNYSNTLDGEGINAAYIAEAQRKWAVVEPGQESVMDVGVFNVRGLPSHVGICIGNKQMIHIQQGIDVSIESYNHKRWCNRLVGFYRYG